MQSVKKVLKRIPRTTIQFPSSQLSEVLERIVHEQTMEFLDKHNILYKFQSGFLKNYSPDFCLSYLTDKISKGLDSGLLAGMTLIDLQKVFDTIDHNILLVKM